MFDEDDLLPISALQHLVFCPRQCALIHLEGAWSENRLTAEGRQLHDRTHQTGQSELRGSVHTARGLPLRSLRLGLSGKADVVEFYLVDSSAAGEAAPPEAVRLADRPGWWRPEPVEYKHGDAKQGDCDRVQLCAQALCLEEMVGVHIAGGALFYGRTRRREDVVFDDALRGKTEQAAAELRQILAAGVTPQVPVQPKCKNCSLREQCLPDLTDGSKSVQRYLQRVIADHLAGTEKEDSL